MFSSGGQTRLRGLISNVEYARDLEQNLIVACMVETPEAVGNIDDIVAVEGLGMVFVGPFDLSTGSELDYRKKIRIGVCEYARA